MASPLIPMQTAMNPTNHMFDYNVYSKGKRHLLNMKPVNDKTAINSYNSLLEFAIFHSINFKFIRNAKNWLIYWEIDEKACQVMLIKTSWEWILVFFLSLDISIDCKVATFMPSSIKKMRFHHTTSILEMMECCEQYTERMLDKQCIYATCNTHHFSL